MLEYIPMQSFINFGNEFYFRNTLTLHFNSCEKLSYSFFSSNSPDYDANPPHENPHNTLRIGLHGKLINLTPLFTPISFSDAFYPIFGYPCYILTMWNIFCYISFHASNDHSHCRI